MSNKLLKIMKIKNYQSLLEEIEERKLDINKLPIECNNSGCNINFYDSCTNNRNLPIATRNINKNILRIGGIVSGIELNDNYTYEAEYITNMQNNKSKLFFKIFKKNKLLINNKPEIRYVLRLSYLTLPLNSLNKNNRKNRITLYIELKG